MASFSFVSLPHLAKRLGRGGVSIEVIAGNPVAKRAGISMKNVKGLLRGMLYGGYPNCAGSKSWP